MVRLRRTPSSKRYIKYKKGQYIRRRFDGTVGQVISTNIDESGVSYQVRISGTKITQWWNEFEVV